MSKYQVDDRDRVVLVDLKTRLTIITCTRLVGDELSNNNQYEVIDVSKAYVRYGKNAKALDLDEIPSVRDVNRYAEAFVQYSSAIAAALEKGKNVVCYCNNGRSRSPSVAAAFYIIYRGMSLNEIKMWYREAYHKQRPETAKDSVNFPNLHRFEQILVLLQKCLANPNETVQGFNLADSVSKCSSALETPLQLAGVISLQKLDPTSFPPSVRPIFVPCVYKSPAKTRNARKQELEEEFGLDVSDKDSKEKANNKGADISKSQKKNSLSAQLISKKASQTSQIEGRKKGINQNAQWLYNQCSAAKSRMDYPHSTLHLATKVLEAIKQQCSQQTEDDMNETEQERRLPTTLFKSIDEGKKRDIQFVFDISSRGVELYEDNGLTLESLTRVDSESTTGFTEWRDMWSNMKQQGWCYKVGCGPAMSWCIVHPRHAHLNVSEVMSAGKKEQDYFTSVEAVKRYARQYLGYRGNVETHKPEAATSEHAVNAKKKKRKRCSVYECTNGVIKGGVCWRHGAKELSAREKKCREAIWVKKTVSVSCESVCSDTSHFSRVEVDF